MVMFSPEVEVGVFWNVATHFGYDLLVIDDFLHPEDSRLNRPDASV